MADIIVIPVEWVCVTLTRTSRSGGYFCFARMVTFTKRWLFVPARGGPSHTVAVCALLPCDLHKGALSPTCRLVTCCKADHVGFIISALRPARTPSFLKRPFGADSFLAARSALLPRRCLPQGGYPLPKPIRCRPWHPAPRRLPSE